MSDSFMTVQSFLHPQSSAMSQRRQKIRDSLRQDTRSLRTEKGEKKKWSRQSKRLPLLFGEKKDEDLECDLQLSAMDVDEVSDKME